MTEHEMQSAVEPHLERIERILGKDYCLTLVARYIGEKPLDADIVLTLDKLPAARDAISRRIDAEKRQAERLT